MTEIQIPYLPSAQFFKIRCRLGINEQDVIWDSDGNPQIRTIGGTVSISAMVPRFRYTEADGRSRVVYTKTETYNIQTSTGELFDADGNIGVALLNTNSPQMDPQGWTYRATVRPNGGEPFDVPIPSDPEGGVFDLGDGLVFTPSTGITTLETRVKALEDAAGNTTGLPENFDEAVQDIVGAMVTGAGGVYYDASGEIALPSGGGGSSLVQVGTLTLPNSPATGQSVTVLADSFTILPPNVLWDTGGAPTITGRMLATFVWSGTEWLGTYGLPFYVGAAPDTTPPVAGTLASALTNSTGFLLAVNDATDDGGFHAQPYRFSLDGGSTWSAWQTSEQYVVTGRTPGTAYTCRHEVRDAAGNTTLGTPITVTTATASTAPVWETTFTMGAPTHLAVVASASALATDDVAVTGYEVSYNGGTTWAVITPSGTNFTLSGTSGNTYADTKLRAKDAAGNSSPALAVPPYTLPTSTFASPTFRASYPSTGATNVPIGSASATRTVIVAWGGERGGATFRVPTACTIGGVAATRDVFSDADAEGGAEGGANRSGIAIFRAVVPTGTTANITFSGTEVAASNVGFGVWTSDKTLELVDAEVSTQNHTVSLTIDTGSGFLIAHGAGDFGSATWDNATERYDVDRRSGADALTDGLSHTITFHGWICRMAAASYQESA